jgi:DNA repair photolyase
MQTASTATNTMIKINKIEAKSVLSKSNLPEAVYCINPYVGCFHGCVYCYARFMRRFTGHKEPWGKFLDIKENAASFLEKELKKAKKGLVLLSSVTDPYQPIEKKYELTREILKTLLKYQFPVSILTKSSLVLRDIDLLKKFHHIEVGITITTTIDSVSKIFEPYSSRASERISTLQALKNNGIYTYAFIGPILPGFTDLEQIFKSIEISVNKVMAESLNPNCGSWDEVVSLVQTRNPEMFDEFNKNTHDKNYWITAKNKVTDLCEKHDISLKGFYIHNNSK